MANPMADGRIELAKARILVTNDDGIGSPGIKLLEEIARDLSPDVWVVAPEQEQSAASHSLTTRRPLRMSELAERRYAVDGTPTDCVMLAIKHLLREHRPDLVLSGVNGGGNVGEDLTYSGTVAAAMEATLLDIPAIALSQHFIDGEAIPWHTAARFAPEVIRRLTRLPWPEHTLMNINFPAAAPEDVRGIAVTSQGKRAIASNLSERLDPRGRPYYWIGPVREDGFAEPGTDLAAINEKRVSVTPIYLNSDQRSGARLAQKGLRVTPVPAGPVEPGLIQKKLRLLMELRRAGIGDTRVLGAIEKTPREKFVPASFEDQAYENMALPIGNAQTVSQPYVVALMTEKLELGARQNVIEIGTGSGYQTAVLAALCRRVFTIERHRELLRDAERRFEELRLRNIVCRFGDGTKGWPEQAPYERVLVTAAAAEMPATLADALAPGGILVVPVGEDHRDQQLVRIRRRDDGFSTEDLGLVRFVPLVAGLPRRPLDQSLT